MLKVGLIVGSTRPNRFADIPARWLVEGASARRHLQLSVLDLRDFRCHFSTSRGPRWPPGASSLSPRQRLGANVSAGSTPSWPESAESNHGPTAVLKNAFDSALNEWQRKPIAFVGYGGVGAARAIETLRGVVIELQMAPITYEVNVAMEPFLGILQKGRALDDYEYLCKAARPCSITSRGGAGR